MGTISYDDAILVRLECTSGRHNKYYEMEKATDSNLKVSYGRINSSATMRTEKFLTNEGRQAWINRVIDDKLKKGYTVAQVV